MLRDLVEVVGGVGDVDVSGGVHELDVEIDVGHVRVSHDDLLYELGNEKAYGDGALLRTGETPSPRSLRSRASVGTCPSR